MDKTTEQKENWRLILSPAAKGSWNMAVDDALLETVNASAGTPILRLYAWQPPCLSLGYGQSISAVEKSQLHQLGWDLVRRPTGGQAILHTDELTYAIIGSQDVPLLQGSVLESYQKIALVLLLTLEKLGIQASSLPVSLNKNSLATSAVCFEVPSHYEITFQGKKILGSAQARRKSGVLQHGSLPLYGDITRITQALVYPTENERDAAAHKVRERATTLEQAIGKRVTWQQAAEAMLNAFHKQPGVNLIESALTDAEIQLAQQIEKTKYSI